MAIGIILLLLFALTCCYRCCSCCWSTTIPGVSLAMKHGPNQCSSYYFLFNTLGTFKVYECIVNWNRLKKLKRSRWLAQNAFKICLIIDIAMEYTMKYNLDITRPFDTSMPTIYVHSVPFKMGSVFYLWRNCTLRIISWQVCPRESQITSIPSRCDCSFLVLHSTGFWVGLARAASVPCLVILSPLRYLGTFTNRD